MAVRSTAGQSQPGAGQPQTELGRTQPQVGSSGPSTGSVVIDANMARKYTAELIGTALLVFFGAGMATISFGFHAFGSSVAAGILLTGLTFGLVLMGLVAVIGPISGCHVNPAVTLGQFLARRISQIDAVGYVIAQLVGGLLGALLLLWVMHSSPFYVRPRIGLGANGYGKLSLLHMSGGGTFLAEVIMTAAFVLIVLSATRKEASAPIAGVVIGLSLGVANIVLIPVDGASVNPARSFGPALVTGGLALSQVWLFLLAPLVGAVLAAGVHLMFHPLPAGSGNGLVRRLLGEPSTARSGDSQGRPPAGTGSVTSGTTAETTVPAAGSGSAGQTTPVAKPGDGTGPLPPPDDPEAQSSAR